MAKPYKLKCPRCGHNKLLAQWTTAVVVKEFDEVSGVGQPNYGEYRVEGCLGQKPNFICAKCFCPIVGAGNVWIEDVKDIPRYWRVYGSEHNA